MLHKKIKKIEYEQPKRRAGKTSNNFFSLYDAAMLSFTSYTKIGARLATFLGIAMSALSAILGIVDLVLGLIYKYSAFLTVTAPVMLLVGFIGGIQLFFIGLLGEYIINMNRRIMNRPLVVEEERINFD